MDSYKTFTGHTYQCILSKYRAIFPRWLELKHISMDFKFCLLAPCGNAEIPSRDCNDVIAMSIYSNREQARRRENTQNGAQN